MDDSFGESWDGAEILKCKDLIYKFTVNNNTSSPIFYKIKLSQKSENVDVNLHWPRTGIRGSLDVGETQVVCVLAKVRPEVPFTGALEVDKLKIELGWKLNEARLKQIASQSAQQQSSAAADTSAKGTSSVRFDEKINVVQDTNV